MGLTNIPAKLRRHKAVNAADTAQSAVEAQRQRIRNNNAEFLEPALLTDPGAYRRIIIPKHTMLHRLLLAIGAQPLGPVDVKTRAENFYEGYSIPDGFTIEGRMANWEECTRDGEVVLGMRPSKLRSPDGQIVFINSEFGAELSYTIGSTWRDIAFLLGSSDLDMDGSNASPLHPASLSAEGIATLVEQYNGDYWDMIVQGVDRIGMFDYRLRAFRSFMTTTDDKEPHVATTRFEELVAQATAAAGSVSESRLVAHLEHTFGPLFAQAKAELVVD